MTDSRPPTGKLKGDEFTMRELELLRSNILLAQVLANSLERRESEHPVIQKIEALTRAFLVVVLSLFFIVTIREKLAGDGTIFTEVWFEFAIFLAAVVHYYFFARGPKA